MPYTINENYRLKRLAKFTSSATKVLDIGCSQYPNNFLNNQELYGLDLNEAELPKNYLGFIQGDLTKVIEKNERFDAIIAGEVLEHIEDPIAFLKQCKSCLNKEGLLILSTPNPHSIIEIILTFFLNKRFFYTQDHIMLFPQRWLIRMLERAGFTDIKLYSGGFPIPPFGLIPCPRFFCHQTIAIASISKQIHA
ncbi:MAG: SAM-dependent methyltransferase [Patiriisocius sp.]|jgi:SAM-dependent methyltransferase